MYDDINQDKFPYIDFHYFCEVKPKQIIQACCRIKSENFRQVNFVGQIWRVMPSYHLLIINVPGQWLSPAISPSTLFLNFSWQQSKWETRVSFNI